MTTRYEREEAEMGSFDGQVPAKMLFGWPLFGGWLPLLKFINVPCEPDGGPWDGMRDPGWRITIFAACWLGWGASITLGEPRHHVATRS